MRGERNAISSVGRLAALARHGLFDPAPDPAFDRFARLAARLTGAPVAALTFVGATTRTTKSLQGAVPAEWQGTLPETSRHCRLVVERGAPMVITDAGPGEAVRSYAGAPVHDAEGYVLGALCALDTAPRAWSAADVATLVDLAEACSAELALRERTAELQAARTSMNAQEAMLGATFAATVAGIFVADASGRIVYCNRALEQLTGHASGALDGQHFTVFAPAFARQAAVEAFEAIVTGDLTGPAGELPVLAANGDLLTCAVSAAPFHDDAGHRFVVVTVTDLTHSRRAEVQAARLGRAIDQSRTLMFILESQEMTIVDVSQAAVEALGLPREALIGTSPAAFLATNNVPEKIRRAREWLLAGERALVPFETAFRRSDGSVFPVEVRLTLSRDEDPPVVVAVANDISHRRQLEESERRLAQISDAASDGIYAIDAELCVTAWNRAVAAGMRLPKEVVMGRRLPDLIPAEQWAVLEPHVTSILRGGPRVTVEQVLEDQGGRRIQRSLFPLRAPDGSVTGVGVVVRDITSLRALEETDARYRQVVELAREGIWVWDREGRTVFANRRMAELLGADIDELAGRPIGDFLPLEAGAGDDPFPWLATRPERCETRCRRCDGSELPVLLSLAPLEDGNGAIALVMDISGRKKAEARLEATTRRLSEAIEGSLDAVLLMDALRDEAGAIVDFRVVNANSRAEALFSLPPTAERGLTLLEAAPPEFAQGWLEHCRRVAESGEPLHAEVEVTGGRVAATWLRLQITRVGDGVALTAGDISALKWVEASLREANERYIAMMECTPLGVFVTDANGNCTYVNAAYERIAGLTLEQAYGRGWVNAIHPDDRERVLRDWAEATTAGRIFYSEHRFVPGDGTERVTTVRAAPFHASDGVSGFIGTVEDVTERRSAEEAVRRSEERYRTTFESLYDVFFQTDMAGVITLISPSCLRHTGYTPDELIGLPAQEIFVEPSQFAALVVNLAMIDTLNDYEAEIRRRDGTTMPVSVSASIMRDLDGTPLGYQGTMRDISERKKLEEERDRIFRMSIDMLATLSVGRFTRVNPAWERTLGYAPAELLGKDVFQFAHPDDLPRIHGAIVNELLAHGELEDLRARFRAADGSYRWLSWNVVRVVEDDEAYAVVRDIDDQVRAEQEQHQLLEALEANALVLAEQAAEMDGLRQEAERLAMTDALTGVRNRRAWWDEAKRNGHVALAIFDVDHFKVVNDTYGHPAGDVVLREVAHRLEALLGERGVLGRMGGEEFAAFFDVSLREAAELCAAIVEAIPAEPIVLPGGESLTVSVSAGLAPWRRSLAGHDDELAAAYDNADRALYAAKRGGRRRLVVFEQRAAAA